MPWLVSGERVLASLEVIDSAKDRARGLLGRSSLDGAVMLVPAKSVHTVGMKFPIDVVYCRKAHGDTYEVMAKVTMPPHRVGLPRLQANAVIELEAGACDRLSIEIGDQLEVRLGSETEEQQKKTRKTQTGQHHDDRAGSLVLVATPIGNLGDLSPRAIEALHAADVIACEDTRHTGKLLAHVDIRDRKLIVVNDHSERDSAAGVLKLLQEGRTVAVVTDAGLPGISDPGQMLVAVAVEHGLPVTVIPGPSAGVTALVGSGLDTNRWVFEGFLPRKGSARSERLLELAAERRTLVLYESPHRLHRTMTDLANVFGPDRKAAIARELTKLHEQYWRGTLDEAVAWSEEPVKGEIVIVVEGAPAPKEATDEQIVSELRAAISDGESTRDAVERVTSELGVAKNRAKGLAHQLDDS